MLSLCCGESRLGVSLDLSKSPNTFKGGGVDLEKDSKREANQNCIMSFFHSSSFRFFKPSFLWAVPLTDSSDFSDELELIVSESKVRGREGIIISVWWASVLLFWLCDGV